MLYIPMLGLCQQVRFYDSQFRLPGSLIDRIFQDPHGNIWFTGKSGAIKYGGSTFTREQLRYTNAPSLPWVKCMAFLDNEKILYGTSRGMILNDCMRDTFMLLPSYVNDSLYDNYFVSSIIKSEQPEALLVTCSGNGITAFSPNDFSPMKTLTDTLNSLIGTNFPGALFIDSRNCLWTFSSEGNFIKIDLKTLTRCELRFHESIKNPVITSMAEDIPSGDLIITTNHHGILRYSRKDNMVLPTKANFNITGCVNVVLRPQKYETS